MFKMMKKFDTPALLTLTRFVLVSFLFAGFAHEASAQQFTFSAVAVKGQPAPGTPAGVNFSVVGEPSLNAAGQSAFLASLSGAGVSGDNNFGIWIGEPGRLKLLAREGDPAPGTATGVNYGIFASGYRALNAAGQSTFRATLIGPGVARANDLAIWSGAPGSVALLARKGDPAPGTPAGVSYDNFPGFTYAISAAGHSVFYAVLTGPGVSGFEGNHTGLWVGSPGSVSLLARGGDPAPGTAAGVKYQASFGRPSINAAGQIAFSASVTGPGVTDANRSGLWLGSPGSVSLVARAGDQAPGTAAGVKYLSFGRSTINKAGQIAFVATITGPGVTFNEGIWSGAPGSVALLALAGEPAPGAVAGVNYSGFGTPTINAAGQSAFLAGLTGPGITEDNDTGIWSGVAGSVGKIFMEREPAPGAGKDIVFGHVVDGHFAFNDRGTVAFFNRLTGPGVTFYSEMSLWTADDAGTLAKIVRSGDLFDVAPGDTRKVLRLAFAGNFANGSGDEDGLPNGFNDLGQVGFIVTFTDDIGSSGTHIFIATPSLDQSRKGYALNARSAVRSEQELE